MANSHPKQKPMNQKSKPPKARYYSEFHHLRVNILQSASWLATEIKEVLDPFGITQKQFNILRILRGHKGELPLTILEIRERMIDKMSDASRIIDRLLKKELLEKRPCTLDKRATRILITQKGLDLLAQLDDRMNELDKILSNLTGEEASQLNKLLDKLRSQ